MTFDTLITPAELSEIAGRRSTCVVDCRFSLLEPERGRSDYDRGHVPGAVYAHLDEDLAGPVGTTTGRHPLPDAAAFIACLRSWGISNDSQVVAYDDGSGGVAARLWWMLRWLGHDSVAVLDGGYAGWVAAGLPVSDAVETPEPGAFRGRADEGMTTSADELDRHLASAEGYILVDAREARRFRGEVEPIDPVAGHVPGALNLPFALAIDETGAWKPPEGLKALWDSQVPELPDRGWAVMCGSGVTACHLALSAKLAGRSEPRLYVESWSGWQRNPDRPVATAAD